jgi:hypothetical protein
MPGSPEMAGQGLNFRLVEAAANRVEEDFHDSNTIDMQFVNWRP